MRRLMMFLGVLAFMSSGALAASLYEISPVADGITSEGRAITPDGKYVGVMMATTGKDRGAVWDVDNGTRELTSGGLRTVSGATGMGYRTAAGSQQLLAYAMWDGSGKDAPTTFISIDGGATWSTVTCATGATPLSFPGANTLVGSASDVWYGHYMDKNHRGNLVRGLGSPPSARYSKWFPASKSGTKLNGTGGAGIVAGSRPIGGIRRNAWYQGATYTNDKNATEHVFLGLDFTSAGEAFSVSLDGSLIGGMSPVADGRAGKYPYVYDRVGVGGTTELPMPPEAEDYSTNGVVYGMGPNNNWACGMMYPGMEKAVLWNISNPDPANWYYVDLTEYADSNGVLGNFTGNLRRAYSVGVDDLGQPVVTGWGVTGDSTSRGFVLTVCTEPIILAMDIYPADELNELTVNKKGGGKIPIEIYGSEELAGEDIDPMSIRIEGVGPVKGENDIDYDGDGVTDVKVHFNRRDLIDAMSLDAEAEDAVVDVVVTGAALGGCPIIEATDSIIIHHPSKP